MLALNTKYDVLGVEFDQQAVINSATVEIESGGTPQTATDAASISEYFVQSQSILDSLLSTNAQALTLADYLLDPDTDTAIYFYVEHLCVID